MPEATTERNNRRSWTADEVQQLRKLAAGNTPVGVMSIKLGRSLDPIRSKASTPRQMKRSTRMARKNNVRRSPERQTPAGLRRVAIRGSACRYARRSP